MLYSMAVTLTRETRGVAVLAAWINEYEAIASASAATIFIGLLL
jgi:hypothetical protein